MTEKADPFSRQVVLTLPGTDDVLVLRDLPWSDQTDRFVDVYRPADAEGHALPAVVLVTGYPDPGFKAMTRRCMKDTAPYESWTRLMAASGLAAVTYTNRDPVEDASAVMRYLTDHGDTLGIDTDRFGI